VPPFDSASAALKVRLAEDAWNTRDPARVSLAYTKDSIWRNRSTFLSGRDAIIEFLTQKWAKELEYRLIKELWACQGNRIAVRFAYESHDASGRWYRSYGNENWEFDAQGLMRRRIATERGFGSGGERGLARGTELLQRAAEFGPRSVTTNDVKCQPSSGGLSDTGQRVLRIS